jgi:hypothetical protein
VAMISAKNHDAEIDEAVWWPNFSMLLFLRRNGMLIIFISLSAQVRS